MTWVEEYLVITHGKAKANRILDDIDNRYEHHYSHKVICSLANQLPSIAIVPPFSGLRRFPEGRGFKQWTGDDSKALMKVS